VYSLKIILEK